MTDKNMMKLDALLEARAPCAPAPLSIPEDELCRRYESVFTAAVNDALRERNILHQTLPGDILPLREGMKVAGLAFTVKGCKDVGQLDDMAERIAMLEAISEHSVIAWDTSGDDESAQWGEVMTLAARLRKCRGAVIDGGVRDTDRVLEQNFPVFCRYRTSSGMLGRFRITGWQTPVRIGQVEIRPGDVIFGDIDGVIVVPRRLAVEVLERSEEIQNAEGDIKKWVLSGMPPREVHERGGYF